MKFLSNSIRKIRRRDNLKLIKGRTNCINYSDNPSINAANNLVSFKERSVFILQL